MRAFSLVPTKHISKLPLICNIQKLKQTHFNQELRAQWLHCRPCMVPLTSLHSGITLQGQILQQICPTQNVAPKIQVRTFFSAFHRRKKTAQEIKNHDNIDSHYDLVYTSSSILYVKLGYHGGQIVLAGLGILMCLTAFNVISFPLNFVATSPLEVFVFVALNALIGFGILRVSWQYPLRIYYSELEDQFIAVFIGIHPYVTRPLKIQPGEVQPLSPSKLTKEILPWAQQLYVLPSQKLFLNVNRFILPMYYNKLLGYR